MCNNQELLYFILLSYGETGIIMSTYTNGILLFDTKTKEASIFTNLVDNATSHIRTSIQYSPDEYWFGSEWGIYIYNIRSQSLIRIGSEQNIPHCLSNDAVYALYKDRQGCVWVGTYIGGVNYYSPQFENFTRFYSSPEPGKLNSKAIRDIKKDKNGNIWIGAEDSGLYKYNQETNIFKLCTAPHNVQAILPDGDKLYIALFENSLTVLDINTEKIIERYPQDWRPSDTNPTSSIYDMIKARDGNIYLATSSGYEIFNPQLGKFIKNRNIQAHIQYIFEDHKGIIWFATTQQGIYSLDTGTQVITNYREEAGNNNSLSHNVANYIFEDSKHNLWFGTNYGLSRFDPERKNFEQYTTRDGLSGNLIMAIEEDESGNLWVSTSHGLSCINPNTRNIRNYKQFNGLTTNQFNFKSSFRNDDGILYFGSINGLIRFDPKKIVEDKYIPPVLISSIRVKEKELKEKDLKDDKLVIKYDESTFSIGFSALNYTASEMNQYAYMLEDIDKDWVYCGTQNRAYFSGLPHGKYTFKVKAANSAGYWNEEPEILEIIITPPFWLSTWAYCIYIVILLATIAYIFYYYARRIQRREKRKREIYEREKEKELYQIKLDFFTNVVHEIKTPLSLIKSPLDKIIRSGDESPAIKENIDIMERNTNRLISLVNQLLDFKKAEKDSFSLYLSKINITDLIKEIKSMFKPVFIEKGFSVECNIPETPFIVKADKEAMTKIISNLLNNALKYMETKIIISLEQDRFEDEFHFTVKNDGRTIPPSLRDKIFEPFYRVLENNTQEGIGIGLSLTKSLTELQNGKIEYYTDENNLNAFVVTMPLQESPVEIESPDEDIPYTEEKDTSNKKTTILIVEDNADMNKFLSQEFSDEYNVVSAINGEEATNLLNTEPVHLIVSDVAMPVMDGFELTRYVKTTLEYSHIPVILLTAKDTIQAHIDGLEAGADAYIEKPFDIDLLHTQVTTLLNNRSNMRKYFSQSPLVYLKEMTYSKTDEVFLEKLNELIYANMNDPEMDVNMLADSMNMSRSTFYRKIRAISNSTPNDFINIIRLKRAAELLLEGKRINEIISIVGFNSSTYFSRLFLKQFGMKPSEFVNKHRSE